MLQDRHFEVECTLRPALSDAGALAAARSGVLDALAFDDELGDLAAAHGMSKGRLFQALLDAMRSEGVGHAQTDNSAKRPGYAAPDYASEFGAEEWARLAARADALRQLVRIKVADDNDLRTARSGFVLCKEYFDGLREYVALRNGGLGGAREGDEAEFELMREMSLTAC